MAEAKAKLKSRAEQTELSSIYTTPSRPTVSQLLLSSHSLLVFHVLSFFESYAFVTRKGIDYYLWSILIKLKLAGYHKINEGQILMRRIIENMNSARYSNFSLYKKDIKNKSIGKIQTTLPSIDEINDLILKYKSETGCSIISPFRVLNNELPIISNLDELSKKELWVYDKGVLVEGSPFPNFKSAFYFLFQRK